MEKLATCLCQIEVVHSCNLACPTCYADSPAGAGAHVNAVPLDDLQRRIQGVVDRKGGIEILQLSGGEPTLHPQFFELLAWLQAHLHIDYVLLNTNGVRMAQDDAFVRRLAGAFRYGKFQLYLQFDGVQEAGQQFLRGADLREIRQRCLERCRDIKLPVTLAMTVTPENLPFVWETIDFRFALAERARGLLSADVPERTRARRACPKPAAAPEHRRYPPCRRGPVRGPTAIRGFHAPAVRGSQLRHDRLPAQGEWNSAQRERVP